MEAKGSKREQKVAKKEAKRDQNGAKMGPQSDQNTSKNRSSEKVGSMIDFGCPQVEFLGPILKPKIIKITIFENIRVL